MVPNFSQRCTDKGQQMQVATGKNSVNLKSQCFVCLLEYMASANKRGEEAGRERGPFQTAWLLLRSLPCIFIPSKCIWPRSTLH